MSKTVYWKTRNGTSISVDDMDINHLRNALKYLMRENIRIVQQANEVVDKYNALIRKQKPTRQEPFKLNGDMAQEFIDTYISDDDDEKLDDIYRDMYDTGL